MLNQTDSKLISPFLSPSLYPPKSEKLILSESFRKISGPIPLPGTSPSSTRRLFNPSRLRIL